MTLTLATTLTGTAISALPAVFQSVGIQSALKSTLSMATLAVGLNALQNLGFNGGSNEAGANFGVMPEPPGFKFDEWIQSCEKIGQQACIKEPSSREAAFKVLEYRIGGVLMNNFGQSMPTPPQSTSSSQPTPPPSSLIQDCFSSTNCPDIDKGKVHPRERKAAEVIYTSKSVNSTLEKVVNWINSVFVPPEWKDAQEILRFRKDDLREKLLFISAESDHNGALNPSLSVGILSRLSNNFDLKYVVVRKYEEICEAIKVGEKIKNLAHVVINGHGNNQEIVLDRLNSITKYMAFDRCFSGINPNGKIMLFSCGTGEASASKHFDNIAQQIANKAKRVVIAPVDKITAFFSEILSADEGVLYHPESKLYSFLPFYNKNLFTSFRPIFKNCFPRIVESKQHPRELAAIEAIRTELISGSLLHKETSFDRTKEYLQVCKDDPREKILVFSADYAENKALQPERHSKIFRVFADRFDLRYKVVKTINEICQEIERSAKAGKVTSIVIQAFGTPKGMILSKNPDGSENQITATQNHSTCFSGLEEDGTLILMGGSLGYDAENTENIAQKIANDAQRTVIATTCHIYPENTIIQSVNPLSLDHPGYSYIRNFLFHRCAENNDSLLKTFSPSIAKKRNYHEEL